MSKISRSAISVHLLIVCFFSVTLGFVESISSTKDQIEEIPSTTTQPLMSSPRDRNVPLSNLQKLYPILRTEKLTKDMLSLIRGLRKDKVIKNPVRRMKRKGAFVVSDLDGNQMLVLRKQQNRQRSNYQNQQPSVYDLQNLGLFPPEPVQNYPVASNMVPFQQVAQPAPCYLENSNAGVQRQQAYPSVVVPQLANVLPQPNVYDTKEYKGSESKHSSNDEYFDNFELIPLSRIKSGRVLRKHASIGRIGSTTEASITGSVFATSPTSPILDSEHPKQPVQREAKDLDQPKGAVNMVSLLASALQQAFSVPRDVVLPTVKRESVTESVGTSTETVVRSTESVASSKQSVASFTLGQESSTPSVLINKALRDLLTDYSLKQRSIVNLEDTLISSTESSTSMTWEPIPLFTSSSSFKPEEISYGGDQSKPDWKDFRLGFAFSMLHQKLTPKPRSVLEEDLFSIPVQTSSTQTQTEPSRSTHTDVRGLLRLTPKSSSDPGIKRCDSAASLDALEAVDAIGAQSNALAPGSNTMEKILEVVENIQLLEQESKFNEDLPCNVTGTWSSIAGGMLLNIGCSEDHLVLNLQPKTPPAKSGFLCNPGWTFTVSKPMAKHEIIIVNAANEKSKTVASFVGECRMCSGGATISGSWLVGRPSRNCKDQKATEQLLSDVWTSDTLTDRRMQKLKDLKEKPRKLKVSDKKGDATCQQHACVIKG